MQRSHTEEKLRTFFEGNPEGVACAYLFGSTARGDAVLGSDIDVAVLFDRTLPPTLEGLGLELAAKLEGYIGREVDMLVLNRAPPDLIHRVLRDGTLIHQADASARIRFEVNTRAAYFDLLPYLHEYRRARG